MINYFTKLTYFLQNSLTATISGLTRESISVQNLQKCILPKIESDNDFLWYTYFFSQSRSTPALVARNFPYCGIFHIVNFLSLKSHLISTTRLKLSGITYVDDE